VGCHIKKKEKERNEDEVLERLEILEELMLGGRMRSLNLFGIERDM
jgi:hypothetical protein